MNHNTAQQQQRKQAFPFTATYLGNINLKKELKVVIGIDLGTTYSGVSWIARDNPDRVNCGAPGCRNARDETKVPTVLLKYDNGRSWLFGHEAIAKYNSLLEECRDEIDELGLTNYTASQRLKEKGVALFRHFKVHLKNKTTGYNTLMVKSTLGQQHSLLDLMTKSLSFLSKFALDDIQLGFLRAQNITRKDVLWVVTVPAIWNDFGKAFMRKAAYQAGMLPDESSDQLLLALEPEAASIAVHGDGSSSNLFHQGKTFLMLDIGGGTADFTLHRVATKAPLVLDEVSEPQGGPWGGIFVDCQFRVFLHKLLGRELFDKLEEKYPAEVAEVLDAFCGKKESFNPDNNEGVTLSLGALFCDEIVEDLNIPSLLDLVEQYNSKVPEKNKFDLTKSRVKRKIQQFNLVLSNELMLQFFEPTLKQICTCVKSILDKYEDIDTLAVVGGYGSSRVLSNRIRSEFEGSEYKKTVIVPDGAMRPQAAVVQGAAYFGLYTAAIGTRISKYTYGVRSNIKWYEGCGYPESESEWDKDLQERRVRDVFSKIVDIGTSISPLQKFNDGDYGPVYANQTKVTFPVYRCGRKNPRKVTEPDCMKIGEVTIPCRNRDDNFDVIFTFGPEIRVEVVRQDGVMEATTVKID